MNEVHEECGIAAVYLKHPDKESNLNLVPEVLYVLLSQLQHRGQLSTGISTYNPFNSEYEPILKLVTKIGRVNDLFEINNDEYRKELIRYCKGISGIGHVRYATAGSAKTHLSLKKEAQPFLRDHGRPWKRYSIAFNGNLANYSNLRQDILDEGYILDTNVDTEVIMHLISLGLKNLANMDLTGKYIKPDLFEISKYLMNKMEGAYNIFIQFADGNLVVIRDHLAFKPLVWGETEEFYAIASESVALEKIGITKIHSVNQGTCMIFNKSGVIQKNVFPSDKTAHCQFEWVYFSRANSIIDDKSVNLVRKNLGRELANIEPLKLEFSNEFSSDYIVVPVPNTAIPAAESYAKELKLQLSIAITKTDGSRGFINKEEERKRIMSKEYNIINEEIKGKKVILIEDSIVRGETSKRIVSLVRNAGAKEVHFRSTEPPIISPCFYGIDFPTSNELIATKYSENIEENVAREIGADSVKYQTLNNLIKAIGLGDNRVCLACLNGKYPTPSGSNMADKDKNQHDLNNF